MTTETPQKVIPVGEKVLKTLRFDFLDFKNPDKMQRKSNFILRLLSGIYTPDGYREDENPLLTLSMDDTKILLQDEITIASGKTINGAEYAECTAIMCDRSWAGNYKYVAVELDI